MKTTYQRRIGKVIITTIAVALLATLAGCQYHREALVQPQPVKTEAAANPVPRPKVILEPGDVLDIKFFHAPQLNETQTIRPDGKITLQLIHEVEVVGKTPMEVRDELIKRYSEKLKETELAVIVRSLPGRVVYVTGEVVEPGVIQMPGRLTALEAIMRAHGFGIFANKGKVVVIRHKDGKRQWFSLDFKGVLERKKSRDPFHLEPRDIVHVSR